MKNVKMPDPVLSQLNSEEAQRYAGIRHALMNPPKGFTDPHGSGVQYGVIYPEMPAQPMEQQVDQTQQPVQGGRFNGGIRPDGMLPPAVGGDPADSMAMAMPRPMQNSMMQPQSMPGNAGGGRGLGLLLRNMLSRNGGGMR